MLQSHAQIKGRTTDPEMDFAKRQIVFSPALEKPMDLAIPR
jgi:hypothetical protein